jgi:hypothetical protein
MTGPAALYVLAALLVASTVVFIRRLIRHPTLRAVVELDAELGDHDPAAREER